MKDVLRYFAPHQGVTAGLKRLAEVCGAAHSLVLPTAEAFHSNMVGALWVASCTSVVTLACTLKPRRSGRPILEVLSQIGPTVPIGHPLRGVLASERGGKGDSLTEKARLQIALENLQAFQLLMAHSQDDEIHAYTQELLRQAVVLAWGGLEVMATDLMERCLNARPEVLRGGTKTKDFLRELRLGKADIEAIQGSARPGTEIRLIKSLQSINLIKAFFNAILSPDYSTMSRGVDPWINSPRARAISEKRNLVVHRRGLVDKKYLDSCGENLVEGSTLHLDPKKIQVEISDLFFGGAELIATASLFLFRPEIEGISGASTASIE